MMARIDGGVFTEMLRAGRTATQCSQSQSIKQLLQKPSKGLCDSKMCGPLRALEEVSFCVERSKRHSKENMW